MEKEDYPELSRRVLKRLNYARYKSREELKDQKKDWSKNKYHATFQDKVLTPMKDTCLRVDSRSLSIEEFREKYEVPKVPIVLTHVMDEWPASEKWTIKKLSKKFRNQSFKVGEDNKGHSVKLKMKYYQDYMKFNQDDSPLYIFDGNYGDHRKKCKLLEDYSIPKYFAEDLLSLTSERRRPPYRWVVLGPERSGTSVHIDPLGTSAWNALISGYKRWILFPTHTPRYLLKQKLPDSEAITWFKHLLPQVKDPNWPKDCAPMEVLQGPGETMFVPAGWWHAVINVSDTVAVTQNYVSTVNFPTAWHKIVRGRPKLSKKLFESLKVKRPDLAEIALNTDITKPCGEASDSSSGGSTSSSSSDSSSESDRSSKKKKRSSDREKKMRSKSSRDKEEKERACRNGDNLSRQGSEYSVARSSSPDSPRTKRTKDRNMRH